MYEYYTHMQITYSLYNIMHPPKEPDIYSKILVELWSTLNSGIINELIFLNLLFLINLNFKGELGK